VASGLSLAVALLQAVLLAVYGFTHLAFIAAIATTAITACTGPIIKRARTAWAVWLPVGLVAALYAGGALVATQLGLPGFARLPAAAAFWLMACVAALLAWAVPKLEPDAMVHEHTSGGPARAEVICTAPSPPPAPGTAKAFVEEYTTARVSREGRAVSLRSTGLGDLG
jgi:hypothetical protein